jgi:hypothetical protein
VGGGLVAGVPSGAASLVVDGVSSSLGGVDAVSASPGD